MKVRVANLDRVAEPKLGALPFAIGLGTMLLAAQISGISVVLPLVNRQLHITISGGQWILTTYTLVLSCSLLVCGRLGDRAGLKKTYVSGLVTFTLASGFCAIAPNLAGLIVLRGIQGIGAGMISATSVALIAAHIGPARRGGALGWQTGMTNLGLAVGPTLAALIVERFSWRSLFYMYVPACCVAIAVMLASNTKVKQPTGVVENKQKVSLAPQLGLIWIAALVPLLLALGGPQTWGWFSLQRVGLMAFAVLGLGAFVAINRHSADPLLPAVFFHEVAFSITTAAEFGAYLCLYAVGFLMPLYLVHVRAFGPVAIGLIITCQSAGRTLAAPVSGRLIDRLGVGLPWAFGVGSSMIALICLCQIAQATTAFGIGSALVLLGIGTGLFVPANSAALLGAAPTNEYGAATGVLATARNFGMTLGVAIAAAMYSIFGGVPGANSTVTLVAVRESLGVITALYMAGALAGALAFNRLSRRKREWTGDLANQSLAQ